jgi:hypothetical protein
MGHAGGTSGDRLRLNSRDIRFRPVQRRGGTDGLCCRLLDNGRVKGHTPRFKAVPARLMQGSLM